MKIELGNIYFKSKAEAIRHTKKVVHDYERYIPITTESDRSTFELFDSLINMHPESTERIGIGVDYFFVKPNAITPRYGEINFRRIDGSTDNFSFNSCLKARSMKPLYEAMRVAVFQQILDRMPLFENHKTCLLCDNDYHLDNPKQIDHVIKFRDLVAEFLEQFISTDIPTNFADEKDTNRYKFKKCDEGFENEWIGFHGRKAQLRCICRKCNIKLR